MYTLDIIIKLVFCLLICGVGGEGYITCMPGACEDQKRVSDLLRQELELSATMWVLGVKRRSFGKEIKALNH